MEHSEGEKFEAWERGIGCIIPNSDVSTPDFYYEIRYNSGDEYHRNQVHLAVIRELTERHRSFLQYEKGYKSVS